MSIRVNSSSEYLGRTSGLTGYNAAYTVAFWVKRKATVSYGHMWAASASTTQVSGNYVNSDFAGFTSDGTGWRVSVYVGGSTAGDGGSDTCALDTWYHVAIVRESATALKLYVDGVQSGATCTTDVSGRSAVGGEWIGNFHGVYYSDIEIAGFKSWSRALTATEINDEAGQYLPVDSTDLVSCSPFTVESGSPADVAEALTAQNGTAFSATDSITLGATEPSGVVWGGAGGSTYNDTLTETATVSDSYATTATFENSLTEGTTVADSYAAENVVTATVPESATLGDSYEAAVSKDEAITETVTVADSLAAVQVFAEAPSEAVTLGESLDARLLIAAVFSEGITLDATLAETISKDETLEESLTLADALSSTLLASATVSEGLPLDTTLAIEAVYNETLSEGLTLAVDLADEHIQGGVYNDTLTETLTLDDSYASTLSAAEALSEGITLDASFYTPPLGQSVRSGGGGGGRAWGWELDREVEEEMGVLLEGPPLTPATIEAVARRLDAPAESRIIGLKQPPVPAVSFDAAMVRRRRIRRRLLLLL
jgi:hypothetical protein